MIKHHPHTQFKKGHERQLIEEYQEIRVRLQLVLEECSRFCEMQGQPFMVTDLISNPDEDAKLKRLSTAHSEGRAADIRIFHWPEWFQKKFEWHFEERFKHWAAISKATGQPNLIQIHDNGNGHHAHIQIKPYKES